MPQASSGAPFNTGLKQTTCIKILLTVEIFKSLHMSYQLALIVINSGEFSFILPQFPALHLISLEQLFHIALCTLARMGGREGSLKTPKNPRHFPTCNKVILISSQWQISGQRSNVPTCLNVLEFYLNQFQTLQLLCLYLKFLLVNCSYLLSGKITGPVDTPSPRLFPSGVALPFWCGSPHCVLAVGGKVNKHLLVTLRFSVSGGLLPQCSSLVVFFSKPSSCPWLLIGDWQPTG
jgi:hypothetical protein